MSFLNLASQPSPHPVGLSPTPLRMKGKHWLEPKTLAPAHMRLATCSTGSNQHHANCPALLGRESYHKALYGRYSPCPLAYREHY